jgi:hypothetical protein
MPGVVERFHNTGYLPGGRLSGVATWTAADGVVDIGYQVDFSDAAHDLFIDVVDC